MLGGDKKLNESVGATAFPCSRLKEVCSGTSGIKKGGSREKWRQGKKKGGISLFKVAVGGDVQTSGWV